MDRIVVFLNGGRGMAVVKAVHKAGHGIDAIVAPAAKAGALSGEIEGLGLACWPVENVNDDAFIAELAARSPQLVLVAGFSTILRQPVLDVPALGAINLHGGRLPEYRGGSPLNWQIINGEGRIGISVLRVDEGIDTGDILAEGGFEIGADSDIAEVHERANGLFPQLVLEVLERFDRGEHAGRKQSRDEGGYWHQRNEGDGRLRWERMTARQVHDLVRAVTRPYPGAFGFRGDDKIRVFETGLPEMRIHGVPGRVCYVQGQGPFVVCSDRAVLLRDYHIENEADGRLRHGVHLT